MLALHHGSAQGLAAFLEVLMAIARAWYLICDSCGMPGEVSVHSARDARALALGETWPGMDADGQATYLHRFFRIKVDGRMKDLCHECLPKER